MPTVRSARSGVQAIGNVIEFGLAEDEDAEAGALG
jgi:hypothetical protein